MKIRRLSFKNYRAFLGTSDAINVDGKNVLIYGENGSGKSSIFQGLKDFIRAFDVTWTFEASPKHLKADIDDDFNVTVVFDKGEENPMVFDGRTLESEAVGRTFLLNSFLSYKELLRTHLLGDAEVFDKRLFDLLTQTLLREQEIGGLSIGKTLEEIQRLQNSRKHDDKDRRNSLIEEFNAIFPARLSEISQECQKILDYFDQGLTVKFIPEAISIQSYFDENKRVQRRIVGSIALDVSYIGIQNFDHTIILNEARLSALAISLYLGALATNPISQSAKCKILCLDDVFIGLDMTNRLPLLRILNEYSFDGEKPFFKDFQIFITTYDRYWFEVAKKHLGSSWRAVEIFVGDQTDASDVRICDKPVIIQESLTGVEKAKKYFEAFDYFSAGNWLRKALEEEIERLVPATYRIEASKLEGLIDKLLEYFSDCGSADLIPQRIANDLKTFKSSVLNPSSHYDLKSPIYRAEVLEVFKLLEEIKQLPVIERKLLLGMRSPLFYRDLGRGYEAEYVLRENLYGVSIQGQSPRILDAYHSVVSWSLDGNEYAKKDGTRYGPEEIEDIKSKVIKLSQRPERIRNFLGLPEVPDWKQFVNSEGKTLVQISEEG